MFDSVGWGELIVLLIVGLFIVGPERLPAAAASFGRTIRKVRDYATGARQQLRDEIGPEFDELRKPLEDLRGLRNMNPRSMVTNQARKFFDEDPASGTTGSAATSKPPTAAPRPVEPALKPGERPPIDPDAT
ncbi:Sec-independent protein translocase protein TatB [Actinoalloteichus hymeniacidonis]|uniref:Sec-independent protein translocase protein TatB n=1 Tax=Actinoalloteichus hymeniacidonis TaxID=340345 RepID=A0AAC9HLZ0_9PSEU|nr:Sec-independent protein translocase protein TatB [Actinoalloteichus hymeniacidonis]AOS61762.1 twin arginine-targeting protein translocase TatB [Actinoalloteichus hymeniacidonis]MBB5910220.1 sec-independent protein translocase protein TatB [Actinoalloteichus hymeniacidonis]